MSGAHIVIRVPIQPDAAPWDDHLAQEADDYLTFVLYDDDQECGQVVPGLLKDMVAAHVMTQMENGRVRCVAEEVLR